MTDANQAYRYAIYFCPATDSPWWAAGSTWLGRCAETDHRHIQPTINGLSAAEFATLTADPRRYGWHATLKAPFQLQAGVTLADLQTAVKVLCKTLQPIPQLLLRPQQLGHFIALTPVLPAQSLAIEQLARRTVEDLHRFAQPLSEADLARRRQSKLTPEQDALMLKWGYPYVMNQFRFHMSLTERIDHLPAQVLTAVLSAAEDHFANLPPLHVDGLAIFAEPHKGADFRLVDRFELG